MPSWPSTSSRSRDAVPAYCLFDNVDVTDPDTLAEYASKTLATMHAYCGRYVVIGGDVELKEGASMVHFPVLSSSPPSTPPTPGTTRPSTRP